MKHKTRNMKQVEKYTTKSAQETQKFAVLLAKEILHKKPVRKAVVLVLYGDLGAGKTTFLQGFAKGLGIKQKVLSPTFIIMRKFEIRNQKSETNSKLKIPNPRRYTLDATPYKNFYHIDCYRLKNEKDLEILGFKEIVSNPKNIVAIEWPERVKKILPKSMVKIKFKHLKENNRELIINNL